MAAGTARPLRRVNPWLLLLLPAFYLATWNALDGRMPVGHSFAPNLVWSHEWAASLRQGILYPRWMETTFAGLGSPTFHFYGPLSLAATLPFSLLFGLSPTMAVMASFWIALLLLGLGVARLTATLCPSSARLVPALAGVLAMLSPYPLFDTYVRAALAELWGMALFPWLLSSVFLGLERGGAKPRVTLALWTAAFALCHPPTLLLGGAALAVAMIFALVRRADVWLLARRILFPIAAGLCLDAFYLVSAIGDQRYVNIQRMIAGDDAHPVNRLLITDLSRLSIKGAEGFDGSILPGFVGCLIVTVWALRWLPRRDEDASSQARGRLSILVAVAGLAALMMTDLSRGIYSTFPIFNRVQFAWRWMAVLTVASVALWGYLAHLVTDARHAARHSWRIPFFLLSCWLATQAFSTVMAIVNWNKPESDKFDQAFARLSTATVIPDPAATPLSDCTDLLCLNAKKEVVYRDVSEYQPLTQTDHDIPPRTYAQVEWADGNGDVTNIEWRAGWRRFSIDSSNGGRVVLRTTAWLGWRVDVNGQGQPGDKAGDRGRMLIDVPAGKSVVTVTYGGTPSQRIGNTISLAALAMAAGAGLWWRLRRTTTARLRTSA